MENPTQLALQRITEKDASILKWGENLTIVNTDQQKKVEELLTALVSAEKRATDEMNKLLEEPLQEVKEIRADFATHFVKLREVKTRAKELLSNWRRSQAETSNGDILQKANDYWEQRKLAEKTGEVVPLPDLGVTPVAKTSRHNMGTTSYRPHVVVRIVNPSEVEREYCVPSESLLRKAGELALTQGKPMPIVKGAIIEVEDIPVSRLNK